MTPQQIVALIVRLFSIWLVLITLQAYVVVKAFFATSPSSHEDYQWVLWGAPIIPLAAAALAWKFPMSIAQKLVKNDDNSAVLKLPARSAAAVGSTILGMWAVLNSIPQLWVLLIMWLKLSGDGMFFMDHMLGLSQTGYVVLAAVGLWMMFKPWTIARRIFPDEGKNILPPRPEHEKDGEAAE